MISRTRLLSALFPIAMVLGAALLPLATASAAGPSASGHGNLTVGGKLRTFSFNAVTQSDGNVTGEMELKSRVSGLILQADIDCLKVVGNTAIMSGSVKYTNDPTLAGLKVVFKVVDNGEGVNPPRDEITRVQINATAPDCNGTFPPDLALTLSPIEAGNIQVQP